MSHPFEVDTFYSVSLPKGELTPTGKDEIIEWFAHENLPPLPDTWDWVAVVKGKQEYVGTFTKRASKFMQRDHGIVLSPAHLQTLGNLVRQHTHEHDQFVIDITQNFDWRGGNFGDSGSCFFSYGCSPTHSVHLLSHGGALALRSYQPTVLDYIQTPEYLERSPEEQRKSCYRYGLARTWMANRSGFYVIFNGYGWTDLGGDATLVAARVFSVFTGLSYKRVQVTSFGTDEGDVYINAGKRGYSQGYAFAGADKLADLDKVDLSYRRSR